MIAVDVDQRLQLRRIRVDLHLDGLLHHEHADIGDVLTDFDRLRIVVGLDRAHEDRPQAAIEQQRVVHGLVGTGPVGLNFLELPCGLQQRLRFDFTGRCRRWSTCERRLGLHWTFTNLDGSGSQDRGLKLPNFHTSRRL